MAARAIMTMAWFPMLTRFVDTTGVPVETGPDDCDGLAVPTGHG
ncbi:hypothetical protein [Streptomyces sp. I6]|nr:hypothetical protein [Streptomyces sp. I6]